jgi:hypothetical protein
LSAEQGGSVGKWYLGMMKDSNRKQFGLHYGEHSTTAIPGKYPKLVPNPKLNPIISTVE